MSVVEAIKSIGNMLVNFFTHVGDFFDSIVGIVDSVGSFILSAFGFIWYAGKTLITGVFKLFFYVSGTGVRSETAYTLGKLSTYIGPRGVIFLQALLFIIVIRIIVAFVFKILKRDLNYDIRKTNWRKGRKQSREPTDTVEDVTYPRLP